MNVLVVCEDAGGAAALAPVVLALAARGDGLFACLGPVASQVFARVGVALALRDRPDDVSGVDVLLAATSCWGARLEAKAVLAARAAAVPSIGLIDFWSSYAERLSYPGATGLDALPDRLLVIDEPMRVGLVADGVPDERIQITGTPALDRAMAAPPHWSLPPARGALFLSQPMAALYGADARVPTFLGYTEKSVLHAVADVIRDAKAELVVRPHPRENRTELGAFVAALPCSAAVDDASSLTDAVARARIVLGMTTMALVEAALLGAPVLSVQIGRTQAHARAARALPFAEFVVTDAAALRVAVLAALDGNASASSFASDLGAGATARVVAAIDASRPSAIAR